MRPGAAHVGAALTAAVIVSCGGAPDRPVGTPTRLSTTTDPSASADRSSTTATGPASPCRPDAHTPREDWVDVLHGTRVPDPYRWLEDGTCERTRLWTEQQNALSRRVLDRIPGRLSIRAEIERLLSVGDVEAPEARRTRGGTWRYFYLKRTGLQNQPVLLMRDGLRGADKVVIDVNELSAQGVVALDWFYPSRDGRYVAYGTSLNGDENSTLRVRDVGGLGPRDLPDEIHETRHCSLAWKPDGTGFFYTRFPRKGDVPDGEEQYHRSVFEHRIGEDPRQDVKVFGEGRQMTDSPTVELSPNGRWLAVEVYQGWAKNELYLIDLHDRSRTVLPVATGVDALYDAVTLDDRLIVQTNERAPRGRVMSIDPRFPARDGWKEIIAESSDAIEAMAVARGRIVVTYQHDAATRVSTFDLAGRPMGDISLPAIGTAEVRAAEDATEAFVRFRSFVVPSQVLRVPLHGRGSLATEPWQQVDSPLDPGAYVVDQFKARSRDGTDVPYFVVRRRDVMFDGAAASLLTGYGGFNIAMNPRFVSAAGVLTERGGVYVQANLRGGSEFGEAWHRAGMLERKQNVFDDMAAVAHDVVDRKIASTQRLAIMGASNGGLLVAAMVVQQPSLFRVAVARVPLTDMLRYQDFLLGKLWISEYGSSADVQMFPVLLAYSPYHNVKHGVRYPAVLLTAAESDSRVDPMHARKLAAALQCATASDSPVLLRVERRAGHGAGKPIGKQVEEYADVYGFVMSELGMLETRWGGADAPQPR